MSFEIPLSGARSIGTLSLPAIGPATKASAKILPEAR
jgi:hypothetical protein